MAELKGFNYMREKLSQKRTRVQIRYNYYDMKNIVRDVETVIPARFQWLAGSLGWCSKAADSLADRLIFDEFRNDNFNINEIFKMNNSDILFDSAILSSAIAGCSFVYISADPTGFPRLQVIDGGNATGQLDPITGLLTEGYAVLERDSLDQPISEAHFSPGKTTYYINNQKHQEISNDVSYPLLVPIIFKPDAKRPFGHSRISRACMKIMQGALRTIKRSEVAAEFYSFPQKYVLGLSNEAEFNNKAATISAFLNFSKDEDGDRPTVGQFSQQSMSPYIDQMRMFASLFAGETGLTVDDLGFVSDNPSSSEAIKASHENLRLTARKAQRTFGSGFLNVGYLGACLRDKYPYKRQQLYLTKPVWEPIFEPDSSTLSSIGDGVIKINQAIPGYIGNKTMKDLTGIANIEDEE